MKGTKKGGGEMTDLLVGQTILLGALPLYDEQGRCCSTAELAHASINLEGKTAAVKYERRREGVRE